MTPQQAGKAAKLASIGLVAGAAGTVLMSLAQEAEMRLTGRPPSDTPAKALEILANIAPRDARQERQLSAAAHAAFGAALGIGLGALSKVPEPARAVLFLAGAWGLGTSLLTVLGLTDPPTRWDAKRWATDLGHHGTYAAGAVVAFAGLRRLARI